MLTSFSRGENAQRGRWFMGGWPRPWALAAALIVGFAAAPENGAQLLDPEWPVVGAPAVDSKRLAAEAQQRILLDAIFPAAPSLLKQLPPSLAEPSRRVDAPFGDSANGDRRPVPPGIPRLAVRPDGIDGWRPASQAMVPQGGASHPPIGTFFAPSESISQPADKKASAPQTPVNSAQSATSRQPLQEDNAGAAGERTGLTPSVQFRAPQLSKTGSKVITANPVSDASDTDVRSREAIPISPATIAEEITSSPKGNGAASMLPVATVEEPSTHLNLTEQVGLPESGAHHRRQADCE